jgi:predicted metal-binding membrane protein
MRNRVVTAPSEPARLPSGGRAPTGSRLQILVRPRDHLRPFVHGGESGLSATVLLLVVAAWLLAIAGHVGGWGQELSHDRLVDEGAGLLQTLGLFLVGWLMMVAAMMLPSSLPAFRRFATVAKHSPRSVVLGLSFLGGYLRRMTVFGVAALIGDILLHGLVDAWPWLGVRPWLIGGSVLILAGGFELVCLSTHSPSHTQAIRGVVDSSFGSSRATWLGAELGMQQLRRCWPLVLLSFAVGMTNLLWMAALTIVMILGGSRGRGWRVAAAIAGVILLVMGLLVLTQPGWLPHFLPVG